MNPWAHFTKQLAEAKEPKKYRPDSSKPIGEWKDGAWPCDCMINCCDRIHQPDELNGNLVLEVE